MLRITTHENENSLTFQLEGRLAGPWVEALRECWRSQSAQSHTGILQVDLRAVTFVDAAGKALLAEMSRHNAKLIAWDCQMKALVAEIERPCDDSH